MMSRTMPCILQMYMMARSKPCILMMNTRWGYVMSPIECRSIKEAESIARENGMAYRIFDHTGKKIRSGWNQ